MQCESLLLVIAVELFVLILLVWWKFPSPAKPSRVKAAKKEADQGNQYQQLLEAERETQAAIGKVMDASSAQLQALDYLVSYVKQSQAPK